MASFTSDFPGPPRPRRHGEEDGSAEGVARRPLEYPGRANRKGGASTRAARPAGAGREVAPGAEWRLRVHPWRAGAGGRRGAQGRRRRSGNEHVLRSPVTRDDRGYRAPAAAAPSPAQLRAVAACTAKAWPLPPGPRDPSSRQPRSRSPPESRVRDARARPDKGAAPARPSSACRPPRAPARPSRSRWAPQAGPARGAGAVAAEHGEIQQQVEA